VLRQDSVYTFVGLRLTLEDDVKNQYSIGLLAGSALLLTISCSLLRAHRGPLKFEPAVLPDAQPGIPYEAKITIAGNLTPAGQFSISEGALPKGLTLEKVEGEDAARIFGKPEEAGTFHFKVFVWCYGTNVSGQVGEIAYVLVVK
jgi:hypothetical protein